MTKDCQKKTTKPPIIDRQLEYKHIYLIHKFVFFPLRYVPQCFHILT